MKRSDQAFQYVKEKIEKMEWLAGQSIKEQDLADELGFSRTPIRQAFLDLIDAGYLEKTDHKGVIVKQKPMTKKECQQVVEFFELMSLHYLQNLEMREEVFEVDTLLEALDQMKESRQDEEGHAFMEAEYGFWQGFLAQGQNTYQVSLMMQSLQLIFQQTGYIHDVLQASRDEKLTHLSQLATYLEDNQYPYARRELRILFNQLVLNIFQGPAGTPF